jgi:hypothetical protein
MDPIPQALADREGAFQSARAVILSPGATWDARYVAMEVLKRSRESGDLFLVQNARAALLAQTPSPIEKLVMIESAAELEAYAGALFESGQMTPAIQLAVARKRAEMQRPRGR